MGDVKTPRACQLRGQAKTIGRLDMNDSTRKCSACGVEKPETPEHFYFRDGVRKSAKCRPCKKAYDKAYHEAHRESITARHRQYKSDHKELLAEKQRWRYENQSKGSKW